jgi:hypothetical protein
MKKFICFCIFTIGITPAMFSQKVVFNDNFNNNHNNWVSDSANGMSYLVYNGKYVVDIADSLTHCMFVTANIDTNRNFSISMNATHTAGSVSYGFGLYFGGTDANNFYCLLISGNGYYCLGKYVAGSYSAIINWTLSPLIKQGEYITNDLAVVKEGGSWKLMVNGQLATTTTAMSFYGNKVGFVQSVKQRIEYDDLKVTQ